MSQKVISFLKVGTKQLYQFIPKSALTNDLLQCQLCYLGEIHHSEPILQSQLEVLRTLTEWNAQKKGDTKKVAIVFEMFHLQQQQFLNKYHSSNDKDFDLKDLQIQYDLTGIEGFDIQNQNKNLFDVFSGFPPRTMAKLFLNTDIDDKSLWKQIFDLLHIEDNNKKNGKHEADLLKTMILRGNVMHYQYFYYLMSGKVMPIDKMVRDKESGLFDKYGKIFIAQCFKDTVMAYNIMRLWMSKKYDKIVVIAGHGHLDCGYGVKERVEQLLQFNSIQSSEIKQLLLSAQIEDGITETPFMQNVSDYVLFIEDSN